MDTPTYAKTGTTFDAFQFAAGPIVPFNPPQPRSSDLSPASSIPSVTTTAWGHVIESTPYTFQINPSQTHNTIHYAQGTSDSRKVKFVVSIRDHAIVLSLSEDFVTTKDPIQVVVTNASGMEIVVPKGTYTTIPNSGSASNLAVAEISYQFVARSNMPYTLRVRDLSTNTNTPVIIEHTDPLAKLAFPDVSHYSNVPTRIANRIEYGPRKRCMWENHHKIFCVPSGPDGTCSIGGHAELAYPGIERSGLSDSTNIARRPVSLSSSAREPKRNPFLSFEPTSPPPHSTALTPYQHSVQDTINTRPNYENISGSYGSCGYTQFGASSMTPINNENNTRYALSHSDHSKAAAAGSVVPQTWISEVKIIPSFLASATPPSVSDYDQIDSNGHWPSYPTQNFPSSFNPFHSFSRDYPSSSVPPGTSNQITSVASTSGQVYHGSSNFTLAIEITSQQKQVLIGLPMDSRALGSAVEIIHGCGSVCQGPCRYLMQATGDTPHALIKELATPIEYLGYKGMNGCTEVVLCGIGDDQGSNWTDDYFRGMGATIEGLTALHWAGQGMLRIGGHAKSIVKALETLVASTVPCSTPEPLQLCYT